MQILASVEQAWTKKRMGVTLDLNGQKLTRYAVLCGRQQRHVSFEGPPGTDDEGSD